MESIIQNINDIPTSVSRIELRKELDPIMTDIADHDEASQMAILSDIKKRFGLTNDEVRAYKSIIPKKKAASGVEEKQAIELIAIHPTIIDIVEDNNESAFLLHGDNGPEIVQSFIDNDTTFIPPPKGRVPYSLVNGKAAISAFSSDDDSKLFEDIVSHLRSISDLEAEWYYALALWVMHTWLIEKFNYSPILVFHAVAERGKTRTTRGLIHISYRGIATESLRESYLFRITDSSGPTICFDVMDLWKKSVKAGSDDILLQRFERGATVPRVNRPEAGAFNDTTYYDVFGATIIATNENLHHILETRSIIYTMQDSNRSFQDNVTVESGLDLKTRLTAFRARHMNKDLPEVDKPALGRLGDMLQPLRQIVKLVKPDWEADFMTWVEGVRKERETVKQDTFDGQLLKAVQSNLQKRLPGDRMFVIDITNSLNIIGNFSKPLKPEYVSGKLKALGFMRGTRHRTGSTIDCPDEVFYRISEKYGIDPKPTQDGEDVNPFENDDNEDTNPITNEEGYLQLTQADYEEFFKNSYEDQNLQLSPSDFEKPRKCEYEPEPEEISESDIEKLLQLGIEKDESQD